MSWFPFLKKQVISKDEKIKIEKAISEAELQTSGEIKVVIEPYKIFENIEEKAKEEFFKHRLYETEARNAVLFYVLLHKKQFYIFADKGIFEKLGQEYWNELVQKCLDKIRTTQSWVDGMTEAILFLGHSFKEFYPRKQSDKNEIADEVNINIK